MTRKRDRIQPSLEFNKLIATFSALSRRPFSPFLFPLPQAALALVEEETRRYRPTKNYLEHLPPADVAHFETEIMKTEFERLSHRQPMEMLNMKRYELPQPPAGKLNDLTAWKESVWSRQLRWKKKPDGIWGRC